MKGKYCEYYWATRKKKEGWVWTIKSSWKAAAEVLQSSEDEDDPDDKYYETETAARSEVHFAIQDYYT